MAMTFQTRLAVAGMLAAGFKRNEFRVRTPFDRKTMNYLDTRITLWDNNPEVVAPKVPALLENGINVIRVFYKGELIIHILTFEVEKLKGELFDLELDPGYKGDTETERQGVLGSKVAERSVCLANVYDLGNARRRRAAEQRRTAT